MAGKSSALSKPRCDHRPRIGFLLEIGAAAVVLISTDPLLHAAEPLSAASYSYATPFHPTQCRAAIGAGCKALERNPSDRRARLILAEGFLCAGLQDDAWALDAAISRLERIIADEPANFFARLDLADAVRMRYPLSDAAHDTLAMADDLLDDADIGAAGPDLRRYVRQNIRGLEAARSVASGSLTAAGEPSPIGAQPLSLAALARSTQLALTGPSAATQVQSVLDAHLRRTPNDPLAFLLSAELQLGRAPRETVRDLYQKAKAMLCIDVRYPTQCDLATRRIKQLALPPAECTAAG